MTAAPVLLARPVRVVAHRGSSYAVPEHTLAAYEQALAEGADALECDVRLTRDGVLVCVHDRRVDRTSNGRGPVSAFQYAELRQLDFGSWHGGRDGPPALLEDLDVVPDAGPDRRGVLTVDRLLGLVRDTGRHVQLHLETKHPTRSAGRVERALVALLARHGVPTAGPRPPTEEARVMVLCFAPVGLTRVHTAAPALPTVLLMERVPRGMRRGALPPRVAAAGPSVAALRELPTYVDRVHERGRRVHVWTVNEPADLDLVLRLGVDAVTTDRPAEVLRAVRDR